MTKITARMTRGQKAVVRIDNLLETVTAQALAQGYKTVVLADNTTGMGGWYCVKADGCIIGTGNTWTAALTEAEAYLQ